LNAMAVNTSTCRNASDFIPKSLWLRAGVIPKTGQIDLGVSLVAEHMSGEELCRGHGADGGNHRIRRRAPPPAGLPDDVQPLPGASLRFLTIKAIDGFKVQAALGQPENKPPAETTMIVQVHGSGGNLAALPLRVIARALSAKGYAAISISTR
jgi:hypothetical protein